MNNSFSRLIDGMVATLRTEVIPQVGSEFARGQAYGLIYMLQSIRLRADWSREFVCEQLAAQYELSAALKPLLSGLEAPEVPRTAPDNLIVRELEAVRDENDARVCALIDWLETHAKELGTDRANSIETQLRHYMNRQLKWELQTSAKPMFAEMSSGSE